MLDGVINVAEIQIDRDKGRGVQGGMKISWQSMNCCTILYTIIAMCYILLYNL